MRELFRGKFAHGGGRPMWSVAFAFVLALLLAVSGCAGQATQPGGTTKETPTLTVIGPWSGDEEKQFRPVLEEAEKELGVKINYQSQRGEDLQNVLPAQFSAKKTPGDVIFVASSWLVTSNAQHLEDLRSIWTEPDKFRLSAVEADGKIAGIPYALVVKPGFWYRKSFFQANGLEPPKSWDDFQGLLTKIRGISGVKNPIASGDSVGWPLTDVVEHFLVTFGRSQLQLDLIDNKVKWKDPKVKEIFADRIVPLLQDKSFSDPIDWTSAVDLWWNGEYGLYFMGNWITGMVEDPNDLGVFPLPGAKGIVGGTDYIMVPTYGAHKDDAKKLVEFLISKKGMEIRAKQGGKLSSRTDTPMDVYPPADRAVAEAIQGMEILPDLDDTIGGKWQTTFWDQLKLLWVRPGDLDSVLKTLDDARK
ncbi:MAG: ABC transporter substrate-binding protein [Brockia lithotrophica]|nr:ABC transporter substrate-binding protein [Brockia lithotrophica]